MTDEFKSEIDYGESFAFVNNIYRRFGTNSCTASIKWQETHLLTFVIQSNGIKMSGVY